MDKDLKEKLDQILSEIERCKKEASDKGHTFIIIALLILLSGGCQ